MRAIVLAGGPADREPGCLQGLPRPFWPALMQPIVLRLVDQLIRTGVREMSVCANGRTALYADRFVRENLALDELRFTQDPLPRGPAGCIKDNEAFVAADPFIVAHAATWIGDSARTLLERHREQRNVLTVFCLPGTHTPSGIYVSEPKVLEYIPSVGYFDIKEQLIPRLLERGHRVGALSLRNYAIEVVDSKSYLALHHRLLIDAIEAESRSCPGTYECLAQGVLRATDAYISPQARVFGPVIVGPQARIEAGAIVIGPCTVGPGAVIGKDAIVTESAVWAGASISRGATVNRVIIPGREQQLISAAPRRPFAKDNVKERRENWVYA